MKTGTDLPQRIAILEDLMDRVWDDLDDAAPAELLTAAEFYGVDPRWLIAGETSPAGDAAAQLLQSCGYRPAHKAVQVALLTPQPPLMGGVCRYCGCVEERACDGCCAWVDHEQTICTACLGITLTGASKDAATKQTWLRERIWEWLVVNGPERVPVLARTLGVPHADVAVATEHPSFDRGADGIVRLAELIDAGR